MSAPIAAPHATAVDVVDAVQTVVEPASIDDPSVLATWTALAAASGSIFATPEWLTTWWSAFGRDRRLLLATARRADDGAPIALLPAYLAARGPIRTVRFLGHGPTDELGPVCAPADRAAAARAMGTWLQRLPVGWDLAIADEVDGGGAWLGLPGARLLAPRDTQVVDLRDLDADGWLASRSANLRTQLGKAERRLRREGEVRFRTTDDPDRLDADLDAFFDLHERRWASAGGTRSFAGRRAFHRAVARLALERGWLRLRFLEVGGRPVAGLYSFRFAGFESSYQASRDPAFDRWSVGLLAHAHAIRECADEGVAEYRFLRGDEPYKARFATRVEHRQSVAIVRTRPGALAAAALSPLPTWPREAQRLVPAPLAWGTGGAPRVGRP